MNDIEEIQRRLAYALDRIGKGVEGLDKAPAPAAPEAPDLETQAEVTRLQSALKDAEARITSLEADLSAAKAAEAAAKEAAEAVPEAPMIDVDAAAELEQQVARLKAANVALRENNATLRDAVQSGKEVDLDASLKAELESLRAERASEAAEMQVLLGAVQDVADGKTPQEAN
jgi:predicted  nucleic acid-binding Zn-ribbon protein